MFHRRLTVLQISLTGLALSFCVACGGGSNPTEPPMPTITQTATVNFVYMAATTRDAAVAMQFPACIAAVGATHFHPSWQSFGRVNMTAVGTDRWEITFSSVPVGSRERLRVSDPNACDTDPNGASTENVLANGVLLTDVVDTPGNGTEPGLAFTVDAAGNVTP